MSRDFPISNVGQLRAALEGVPDDKFIAAQVVSADGKAWNMSASFCPVLDRGTIAVLTMSHPELKTLIWPEEAPVNVRDVVQARISMVVQRRSGGALWSDFAVNSPEAAATLRDNLLAEGSTVRVVRRIVMDVEVEL